LEVLLNTNFQGHACKAVARRKAMNQTFEKQLVATAKSAAEPRFFGNALISKIRLQESLHPLAALSRCFC